VPGPAVIEKIAIEKILQRLFGESIASYCPPDIWWQFLEKLGLVFPELTLLSGNLPPKLAPADIWWQFLDIVFPELTLLSRHLPLKLAPAEFGGNFWM